MVSGPDPDRTPGRVAGVGRRQSDCLQFQSKIKLLKNYDEDYWTKKQPEVLEKVKDILLRVK